MWSGLGGMVCGVLLVLIFRWTRSGLVHEFVFSPAFRPQLIFADAITKMAFYGHHGHVYHRVVDIATFYDGAISVALGLEFAIFGFGLSFIVERVRTMARNGIT